MKQIIVQSLISSTQTAVMQDNKLIELLIELLLILLINLLEEKLLLEVIILLEMEDGLKIIM